MYHLSRYMSRHLITARYPDSDSMEDINESSCISRQRQHGGFQWVLVYIQENTVLLGAFYSTAPSRWDKDGLTANPPNVLPLRPTSPPPPATIGQQGWAGGGGANALRRVFHPPSRKLLPEKFAESYPELEFLYKPNTDILESLEFRWDEL